MFAELFCREWNSIRVRFWSIGYKKRLLLLIFVLLVLGCFAVWTSFFADLSALDFTQERQDGINDSTLWDKWVTENGFKSIGDIWDSCDPSDSRKKIGKVIIYYDSKEKRVIGTAVANFTTKVTLNSGVVHVVAQFHGRTLYDVKHDVCKVDAKTFGCPMNKGQKMYIYEPFKLPKYIPKGHYFATAKLVNQDDVCLGMTESNLKI
ncbi:hypothetical protein ACROYT_G013383 [Oculina patagonica]